MSIKNISGSTEITVGGGVRVVSGQRTCRQQALTSVGCSLSGCMGIKSPVLVFEERRNKSDCKEKKKDKPLPYSNK